MFADSGAATPSISPFPKFSLFLDHLLASLYPIIALTVPPSAGKIPIKVPIPDDLKIDLPQLLNSFIEGNLIAENFILSNNSSLLDACTNISDMANNPIKTGTKLIPSNNSSTPKVNLEIPVVKWTPIVATNNPIRPPIKFLTGDLELMEASIDKPNIANAKYSGGPNL